MPSHEPVEGNEGVVQKPEFKVKTKPLNYMRASGIFISDHSPKQTGYSSVDDIPVPF